MGKMTLKEFQLKKMAVICSKYKKKILIIFTDERENIRTETIWHCDIAILPVQNGLYDVVKNRVHGKFETLTKTQLEEFIKKLENKGYLIVGEENIK